MDSIAVSILADVPQAIGAQETVSSQTATEDEDWTSKIETEAPPQTRPTSRDAVVPLPTEPAASTAVTPEPPVPAMEQPPSPATSSIAAPLPQVASPASAGVAREYARLVAVTLAKSKPKGVSLTGATTLRFVIEDSGQVGPITIVAPSGSARLDDLAIKSISRSEFPRPPLGLAVDQRTFEVPYSFR